MPLLKIGFVGGRGRRIPEFEASLVYKVSSRAARATQRNPASKKQKKKKKIGFLMDFNITSLYGCNSRFDSTCISHISMRHFIFHS